MLSLSHIDFAYEKGPLLLQDLCMEVHDGDYVAVVGENGSGKHQRHNDDKHHERYLGKNHADLADGLDRFQ